MVVLDVTKFCYSYAANKKRWTQPIACYEIAERTCDFIMTYVGNNTINMSLVMLFLISNIYILSAAAASLFPFRWWENGRNWQVEM